MNLGPAVFIYLYKPTMAALVCSNRNDLTGGELLFTCPEKWKPETQAEFEDAARYYGVQNPQRMKYDANDIPF